MIAEQVAREECPPVKERLPATRCGLEVNDSIGICGGAWRYAFLRHGLRALLSPPATDWWAPRPRMWIPPVAHGGG
jgi:hypothetical protein